MTWYGWLWIDGQWQHVCEADAMTRCSSLLAAEAAKRGIVAGRGQPVNTRLAMTGGGVPAWTPSRPCAGPVLPDPVELDPVR